MTSKKTDSIFGVGISLISMIFGSIVAFKICDAEIQNLKVQRDLFYTIGLGLAGANDEIQKELEELKTKS